MLFETRSIPTATCNNCARGTPVILRIFSKITKFKFGSTFFLCNVTFYFHNYFHFSNTLFSFSYATQIEKERNPQTRFFLPYPQYFWQSSYFPLHILMFSNSPPTKYTNNSFMKSTLRHKFWSGCGSSSTKLFKVEDSFTKRR